MNDLYYPLIGSTCVGLSLVHHQEHHLINCITHWYDCAIGRVYLLIRSCYQASLPVGTFVLSGESTCCVTTARLACCVMHWYVRAIRRVYLLVRWCYQASLAAAAGRLA